MKKINFNDAIIFSIAFLGPLSITFLDKYNLILITFLVLISILVQLKKSNLKFEICKEAKVFILGYVIAIFFSFIGMLSNLGDFTNFNILISFLSRLFTITIGLITLIIVSSWAANAKTYKLIYFIKMSFLITLIFLFFGIYQILSIKYGLPFIETRSSVYGADYATQQELGFRLTSLAREPNFYSPLIFESLIISYLVLNKRKYIIFALITLYIMFKTYSTGVYIHFFLLLIFIFIVSNVKIVYKIFLVIFLVVLFKDNLSNYSYDIYDYATNKLLNEMEGNSLRSYVYITVINSLIGLDLIRMLFGNGINTLSNFGDITGNFNLQNVSVSNNLYLDFFWDSGLLGLFSIVFTFIYLFVSKFKKRFYNKYFFCTLCLLLSLLLTSMYRSEYTTSHFFWVISNIIICSNLARRFT